MNDRPRGPWDFDEPAPPRRSAGGRIWLWLVLFAGMGGILAALFRTFPDAIRGKDDWLDLAWGLSFLVLLSAAVARMGRGAIVRHLGYAAIWTVMVAALALGYAYRDELAKAPQKVWLAFGTGYPIATSARGPDHEVVVPQDVRGAFVLNARVNGQPVRFIVDTGATDTVLSPAAAQRLGVDLKKIDFKESAETANGMGYGATYTAQRLDVGPIAFADFPMVINKAPMTASLLGLSFLNRLDSFEIRDRKLILKWHEPAPPAAAPAKAAPAPAPPPAAAPAPKPAPAGPAKASTKP
jgi:aspartyl protease family protein